MNEQIKELMGQTLDEKFAGTWSRMDMQDLTKFAERFGELIIKECADYVRSNYDSWDAEPLAFNMEKDFGLRGDYAE